MNTFSLLETSLDQTIDRDSFEQASVAARADCVRLHRELFGILVSRLPQDEALAFQAELNQRNFPAELVADRDLPVLHESFQIHRLKPRG